MYQQYFGLAEAPFSIAPAPRYLYMSQRHQEALAHLLYGVNGGGGFVLLTGEVGAGKTTVCRCLLEQIPEACDVAYIFNPKLTVEELLSTICSEFGIVCPAGNTSIKVFVDCINAHLLDAYARGRHAVLIIDEAQNLSADVLEQMRLLTNLETSERKLLQIILIGQPELASMLERPELKQLAQRIVARYHLGPLSRPEVAAYVQHRLAVAGTQRQLFSAALMRRLHQVSGGIPRIVNVLCDRALLGTYVQGKEKVDRKTLLQAEREVLHRPAQAHRKYVLGAIALLTCGLILAAIYQPATAPRKVSPPPVVAHPLAVPADAAPLAAIAWPAQIPLARSEALAYAGLFKAWGADYRGGDPCRQAEEIGLRCRTEHGSVLELRQLDRPAVLTLHDAHGELFQAALLKLAPLHADLLVGATKMRVSLAVLANQWSGDYRLFWRQPAAVRETLRPGDSGPGVLWLRQRIADIAGDTTPDAPDLRDARFDTALSERVRQFQRSRGLNPDGSVGPLTLIHLIGNSDPSAPSLSAGAPDRTTP